MPNVSFKLSLLLTLEGDSHNIEKVFPRPKCHVPI